MDPRNNVVLVGFVHPDELGCACWSRWRVNGRGQVRFWLAIDREDGSDRRDIFLCVIEPADPHGVDRLMAEIEVGQSVRISGRARFDAERAVESEHRVIFLADEYLFERTHTIAKSKAAHGKMAAANDVELLRRVPA